MSNCQTLNTDRHLTLEQLKKQPPLYIQLTPLERSALKGIARPILNHITYCEKYDIYFLDQKHLDVNREFQVGLYPEEMNALQFLFRKISEVSL